MIDHVDVVGYGRPALAALAGAVGRAKAGHPLAPVTVVVPTNLAGLVARRMLGTTAAGPLGGGLANVSFLTPLRLAQQLGADLLLTRRPLTNPVLGAAVRRALAEDPGPFRAVAEHHATEAALANLYGELANLDPAVLARLGSEGGRAGALAADFHRRIAGHLHDFHDEAELARAAARRPDLASQVVPLGRVVWYLPAPAPPPLVELVAAVLCAAPAGVVVGLTGHAQADAAVAATCARAGVAVAAPPSCAPHADRIVSVTDADEEVREVVRRIAGLAADGVPLERIGVFYPVPEPYAALLEGHLAAAGLPANGPSRRRLADGVAGRTLLAALALPRERFRRDRVLALVSGGPLRSSSGPTRPATWELLSRRAGVVGDLADWRHKLAAERAAWQARLHGSSAGGEVGPSARSHAQREVADIDALAAFVEQLAAGVSLVEASTGWRAKAAACESLLASLLGPAHHHGSWPEIELRAHEAVGDALVRLAALDELEADPDHDVFVRALTAELQAPAGRNGRFGQGIVYGPLSSAPGHDLDAVFVVGAAEGLCPAARRDDALLPDRVRQLAGGQLDPRSQRLHEQHRHFLAALAAAPAGRRTLTFPRGDLRANRQQVPSRWLLDSASALAGHPVHATELGDLAGAIVEVVASHAAGLVGAPVAASLEERDAAALAGHVASGGAAECHPVGRLVGRGLTAQRDRGSARFTEWDGNLAGQPIPPTAERPLSPSRLETWAACGMRYYLAYVLGLADRDEPERLVDLTALDRGSGVHTVLERFFLEALGPNAPAPGEPWSPERRARLAEIAGEVFDDYEARGRTGRTLHWRITRADLLALLDDFLTADDDHRGRTASRPERVELSFGLGGTAPVVIDLSNGRQLAFRGRADRVDRGADGRLLVADYKTGKGQAYERIEDGDPVQGGATLQLGLYAEAAVQQLGGDEVEAHYWMVNTAVGHRRLGYRWTDARRQRLVAVLTAIVDGIEAGVFPAEPGEWDGWRGTHSSCRYCEFDAVCPRDRGSQADAKAGDPLLAVRHRLGWEGPA